MGIASIGWAVTETESFTSNKPKRLFDTGVRTFPTAEVPKTGESPNVARRIARSTRKRLRRRRMRLVAAGNFLSQLLGVSIEDIQSPSSSNVWQLRVAALDRRLTAKELSSVLYHLIKHRGFKSSRKDLTEDKVSDANKQKSAIALNSSLLSSKNYRTFSEMIVNESKTNPVFGGRKRNSVGSYAATPTRSQLVAELNSILRSQLKFGHQCLEEAVTTTLTEIMNRQKPFSTRIEIIDKVGQCTLLPTEKRASRHLSSVELFRVWQDLNNLSLLNKEGDEMTLSLENKQDIIRIILDSGKISYKQIRKKLDIQPQWHYKYLRVSKSKQDLPLEKIEAQNVLELPTYHVLRTKLVKVDEAYWEKIKENYQLLDQISHELTVCPTADELREQLTLLKVPILAIDAILTIPSRTGFIHLSLKAVKQLLPFLSTGSSYSEACSLAGLSEQDADHNKTTFFKIISHEDIANPVVLRAVTQTRKLVKAIVAEYGPPIRIHIELARELSKSREKRNEIDSIQKERRDKKLADQAIIEASFNIPSASGTQVLKYRLWKEQNHQCAYSGKKISEAILFNDENATQIDHAQPFSRTLDDSYLNKVLVLTAENQIKRNLTPYEYLGGEENRVSWTQFVARVESWQIPFKKKATLLKQNIPERLSDIEQVFSERALSDTRYISRFIKSYLESNCPFASTDRRRVIVISGSITAFFRNHWGLSKSRDNDRHHAVDATVLTSVSSSMLTEVIGWAKQREQDRSYRTNRFFPEPWPSFHKDLKYRILEDRLDDFWLKEELKDLYSDIPKQIKLLLISRAPNRKMTGQIHKDTYYSAKDMPEKSRISIRKQLKTPIKTTWGGKQVDQKSETVIEDSRSAMLVPRGDSVIAAMNGSMVRIDIFTKDDKYYFAPVYTKNVYSGVLPTKVVVGGKDESEWTEITSDHSFQFSLYPSDYIVITRKSEEKTAGYYVKANRRNATITAISHDSSEIFEGIGLQKLKVIEKFEITLLGQLHKINRESRVSLRMKTHRDKK